MSVKAIEAKNTYQAVHLQNFRGLNIAMGH